MAKDVGRRDLRWTVFYYLNLRSSSFLHPFFAHCFPYYELLPERTLEPTVKAFVYFMHWGRSCCTGRSWYNYSIPPPGVYSCAGGMHIRFQELCLDPYKPIFNFSFLQDIPGISSLLTAFSDSLFVPAIISEKLKLHCQLWFILHC